MIHLCHSTSLISRFLHTVENSNKQFIHTLPNACIMLLFKLAAGFHLCLHFSTNPKIPSLFTSDYGVNKKKPEKYKQNRLFKSGK